MLDVSAVTGANDEVIYSMAISHLGSRLAGGVRGGHVTLDSPSAGRVLLVGHVAGGEVDWSSEFVSGGDSTLAFIEALGFDRSGNAIVVGSFDGTLTIGGVTLPSMGGLDWFVAKFTPGGQFIAARSFGGSLDDRAHAVTVNGDAPIIAGEFQDTVEFGLPAPLSADGIDAISVVLNPDLSTKRAQTVTGPGDQVATGVALGPRGLVVVGHHQGFVRDGMPYSSSGGRDIFLLVGEQGSPDALVRSFGGAGDQTPSAVAVAPDGRIAMTGAFKGDTDFGDGVVHTNSGAGRNLFVNVRSPNGMSLLSHAPASEEDQWGTSVAFDALGNLVVGCGFFGKLTFDGLESIDASSSYDACAAKFDGLDGHALWARQFGNPAAFQAAFAITTNEEAQVFLGGTFAGALPTPAVTLEAFDGKDAFMLRLSP